MSSWDTDTENQSSIPLGNENQWKIGVSKVENSLKNTKKEHDDLKARFEFIQRHNSDIREIEVKRQELSRMIQEMSGHITQLDKILPSSSNMTTTAMNNQLKELKRRAVGMTKMVQKLSSDINEFLESRQEARRKQLSVISQVESTPGNERGFDNQAQISTLDDPDLQRALEEQRQQEKLSRDILTLEEIFVNLSAMVQEQGEVVTRIETNVAEALEKTDAAEKELTKAVDYKRSAFKKKVIIIVVVIAVLAALALIIGLSVGIRK